jgi:hypothetical protein
VGLPREEEDEVLNLRVAWYLAMLLFLLLFYMQIIRLVVVAKAEAEGPENEGLENIDDKPKKKNKIKNI